MQPTKTGNKENSGKQEMAAMRMGMAAMRLSGKNVYSFSVHQF